MATAGLAAAQLARLDECQRELLLRLQTEKASELPADVHRRFSLIPHYIRKLESIREQMDDVAIRSASMRNRAAVLAGENRDA